MSTARTPIERDLRIETLRGLACLLVVTYHISNSKGASGVPMEPGNAFHFINELLSVVRMPLFTFISGYVYATRPLMFGSERSFLLGKFRHLLVPLVAVGGLFLLTQNAIPHAHNHTPILDAWRILVYPYAHFWYLQALTLIFAFLVLLERSGQISTLGGWSAVLFMSVVTSLFLKFTPDLFAVNEALYLLPFFLLGIGIRRFAGAFQGRVVAVGVITAAGASLAIYALVIAKLLEISELIRCMLFLGGGMATCMALMRLQIRSRLLALVGGFSYAIYLFHVFGTAGVRVALSAVGVHNTAIIVIAALATGIALPIAIEAFATHYGATSFLLLGHRWLTPNKTNRLLKPFQTQWLRGRVATLIHFATLAWYQPVLLVGAGSHFRPRFPTFSSPQKMTSLESV